MMGGSDQAIKGAANSAIRVNLMTVWIFMKTFNCHLKETGRLPKTNVGHTLPVVYQKSCEDPDFHLNERREVKSYVAV